MRAHFLLGPAGSGKTERCLAEARQALRTAPEGRPLVFLAPKQATFQLERQLLSDPSLPGYTRLRLLSYERLAEFILESLSLPAPALLSEEGRVMVLRALLTRERARLRVFHATARLPGFARQLSLGLRELQAHRVLPEMLEEAAQRPTLASGLRDKLLDLAWLLRAYLGWLKEQRLWDAQCLLDLATAALDAQGPGRSKSLALEALWLDGFAQLTSQEIDLLAALIPRCERATLAFCLGGLDANPGTWLSPWSLVGRAYRSLRERLESLPEVRVTEEALGGRPEFERFAESPVLRHLERHWASAEVYAGPWPGEPSVSCSPPAADPAPLRLVSCLNLEAEAVFAARTVLGWVRQTGGRFRDVAVLVRSLEGYQAVLRRVFHRYGVPCFIDRRERITHHPLAELTRGALRALARGWEHADWFGTLKTGLMGVDPDELDLLENEALARGWQGRAWLTPLVVPDEPELSARVERVRSQGVPPLRRLEQRLGAASAGETPDSPARRLEPTGAQLAAAVRALWDELEVGRQLEAWNERPTGAASELDPALHRTVWRQMNEWLDNLARAFSETAMPLADWLSILEAGLGQLTVGVIPPSLDQVLIGAVDRSRNPDLRMALVLGLNDGVFPAPPAAPPLLTESDREALAGRGIELGPDRRHQLGRERYLGYIACTRARRQLVLTWAAADPQGRALGPSPFVAQVQRLFPQVAIESPDLPRDWSDRHHLCEWVGPVLRAWSALSPGGPVEGGGEGTAAGRLRAALGAWLTRAESALPPLSSPPTARSESSLAALTAAAERLRPIDAGECLQPAVARRLYGPEVLHSSVSRLEQFAACPFKFFVESGLRAEERRHFEIDARQRGSFQHEVLARFHLRAEAEHRLWRDFTPPEAREQLGRIAADLAAEFGGGLFQADDQRLFTARGLTRSLQRFIGTLVGWMRGPYQFLPRAVELPFGGSDAVLPAWELDLGDGRRLALRGIIDRVDLAAGPEGAWAWCVVIDYKSRLKTVDPLLLAHGIQMQLPAYLAALRQMPHPEPVFGVKSLRPAGVFYVNLRGQWPRGADREAVLRAADDALRSAYQHRGRFDLDALPWLDHGYLESPGSRQFSYFREGKPHKGFRDPMPPGEFSALLDRVEGQLRRLGQAIFAGAAQVDPYQKGVNEVACDHCDYRAICRIDPWTHAFRRLRAPEAEVAEER